MASERAKARQEQAPAEARVAGGPAAPGDAGSVTAATALMRVTDLEIDGVQVQGPTEGFGRLWRKRYWVWLDRGSIAPVDVIRSWKAHFGDFWPRGNYFYGPIATLTAGDMAVLDIEMPAGGRLESGVVVLNTGRESFTLITPEGHIFAGVITFSSFKSDGKTVALVDILLRAGDPLFEIGLVLFGHRQEDRFWQQTLKSLASFFGIDATPEQHALCIDRHYQWANATNIVRNALIRSVVFRGTAPVAQLARRVRGRSAPAREDAQG